MVSFSARSIWSLGAGGHLGLEAQGPHHDDAQDPPGDLPGPQGREAGEGKGVVAQMQAGPMAKKYQTGTMIFMALRHCGRIRWARRCLSRKARTSFWRLMVSWCPSCRRRGRGRPPPGREGAPEGGVHGERVRPDIVGQKDRDHAGQHPQIGARWPGTEAPVHAHE
jgi:hypothetical protein